MRASCFKVTRDSPSCNPMSVYLAVLIITLTSTCQDLGNLLLQQFHIQKLHQPSGPWMCRMIRVGNRDLQDPWQISTVLRIVAALPVQMEHPCSFTSGTQAWVHSLPSTPLEVFEFWEDKWFVFFEGVVAEEFQGGSFGASWGLVPWLLCWASEDVYKWGRVMWRKSNTLSGEFQNEYHVSVFLDLVCFLFSSPCLHSVFNTPWYRFFRLNMSDGNPEVRANTLL
jgi:hypothetical protein